jgi:ubiquinone/menaquinone biosynthesis C-methylase UbiE
VAVGHLRPQEHYSRIAGRYDDIWSTRPEYLSWMSTLIARRLEVSPGARVADVGAGTGLFLRKLAEWATPRTPILCIDPSPQMLGLLPEDARLRPILGTAEDVAGGTVALTYDHLDAILIKEAIHHVTDVPGTLRGLAGLLAPGGRIVVVTLPPRPDYPLFAAALDRFAANHPDPESIVDAMRAAGLETTGTVETFGVSVERERYVELVAKRWMSVLSTFTDDEIRAGIDEMRVRYPQPELRFEERFWFITGVR